MTRWSHSGSRSQCMSFTFTTYKIIAMRVVAHATFPAKPYVTGRRVLFFRGLRRPLRYEARQFQSTRFCHRHAPSCFTATPPQQLPRLHSLLHYFTTLPSPAYSILSCATATLFGRIRFIDTSPNDCRGRFDGQSGSRDSGDTG
jgi:hypothetical protein